ncbi:MULTISPECIES: SOS response-associated peptidase [unclassified Pseudomonas]|uniref:SOS response-associated peptidase n=1 Tax=unclassified Pseudomonas TaxID=196821 RepID=UPI000BC4C930|nr:MULTISPECIES: SOS response-associated peptidase family protein [unclassified Pseudomonas]PVZ19542.1 putative SOS response-associated peptidase YedK [Pseudomonas sp. URIL14HWK12:I12]PVZ22873.1 putative SOS response-associated peptidase YedK [Pseudomonas sp. URIL14HWK12:I10]PVZ37497.1 putative SOS response-associated peptidase YedK [Pseudomonas sp. URIL14HWK12:I11]SNZ14925.1 Putative SOS response-associated peptidase YedK [Pseudomonas sp. URIL14HWK12:I9]
MCGRFVQDRSLADYVDWLGVHEASNRPGNDALARFNVAPSAPVSVFSSSDAGLLISQIRWGWRPHWATGERPPPINARVETVATNRFFREAWPHRLLVPATGWYEWVQDERDPKRKQPYFIRLQSGAPMFFAAIGTPGEGFVILTADSAGGLVDIHDRRPVVLCPELAREWANPQTTQVRAELIAAHLGTGPAEFEWYRVSKDVGNVRNDGPQLLLELPEA